VFRFFLLSFLSSPLLFFSQLVFDLLSCQKSANENKRVKKAKSVYFFFLLLTFLFGFCFFFFFLSSFFLILLPHKTENRKQKVESGSKIR